MSQSSCLAPLVGAAQCRTLRSKCNNMAHELRAVVMKQRALVIAAGAGLLARL